MYKKMSYKQAWTCGVTWIARWLAEPEAPGSNPGMSVVIIKLSARYHFRLNLARKALPLRIQQAGRLPGQVST